MDKTVFTEHHLEQFRQYLMENERAAATIDKYVRDVRAFMEQSPCETGISKDIVLAYKIKLTEEYKSTSANSMLVALNQFFGFHNRRNLQVKLLKVQHVPYREQNKELSVGEYKRLVLAAKNKKDERLSLLIQTICSTGIRVSEHSYITAEALKSGCIRIANKGKIRVIFLSGGLRKSLKRYCREKRIASGPVFVTRNGNPVSRCNIWAEMKALCRDTGINPQKVFPHNLRHLFALTYYRLEKDIVRLADILGHASIETTRIYTSTTEQECIRSMSRLNLLL